MNNSTINNPQIKERNNLGNADLSSCLPSIHLPFITKPLMNDKRFSIREKGKSFSLMLNSLNPKPRRSESEFGSIANSNASGNEPRIIRNSLSFVNQSNAKSVKSNFEELILSKAIKKTSLIRKSFVYEHLVNKDHMKRKMIHDEIDAIYKDIFNKPINSVISLSQLRLKISRLDERLKIKLNSDINILEAVDLIIDASNDNKQLFDIQDSLFFLRSLVDYLFIKTINIKIKESNKHKNSKRYDSLYLKYKEQEKTECDNILRSFNQYFNSTKAKAKTERVNGKDKLSTYR